MTSGELEVVILIPVLQRQILQPGCVCELQVGEMPIENSAITTAQIHITATKHDNASSKMYMKWFLNEKIKNLGGFDSSWFSSSWSFLWFAVKSSYSLHEEYVQSMVRVQLTWKIFMMNNNVLDEPGRPPQASEGFTFVSNSVLMSRSVTSLATFQSACRNATRSLSDAA